MLKRDELADPESCLNRARDDEIIFVLLERDVAMPAAIREWATMRVLLGKNKPTDAQIVGALACADTIDKHPAGQIGRERGNLVVSDEHPNVAAARAAGDFEALK